MRVSLLSGEKEKHGLDLEMTLSSRIPQTDSRMTIIRNVLMGDERLTSFMAASSSAERSTSLVLPFLRKGGALPLPTFCNPAFSLSLSSHDKIVDRIESISNRFESARGAARKARRILLTRRLLISKSHDT